MTGSVSVVGLGPGSSDMVTPEVSRVISEASDLVGYANYISRIKPDPNVTIHASDNRKELDRAIKALELAQSGKKVVLVSSGDPGVFAMASALMEVIDHGDKKWKNIKISIFPGVTAMLAAAARIGAPLGHDFCAINLSDNLKPWDLIEKRINFALDADFVISLYNPRSASRSSQFGKVLEILRKRCHEKRLVIFAKAVGTSKEEIHQTTVLNANPNLVDMSTLVIIGSSRTKVIPDTKFIYTPRSVE